MQTPIIADVESDLTDAWVEVTGAENEFAFGLFDLDAEVVGNVVAAGAGEYGFSRAIECEALLVGVRIEDDSGDRFLSRAEAIGAFGAAFVRQVEDMEARDATSGGRE